MSATRRGRIIGCAPSDRSEFRSYGVEVIPRPFFVNSYFECPFSGAEPLRIPPHRLIIEPLVAVSDEICVFQNQKYAIEVPMPPHKEVKRGRYLLDQTQELVLGWERFWNAGFWRRGAITLRLRRESIHWEELFQWMEYGGVWSSLYQIKKGTPTGAISYCDANAVDSIIVVSLSASNGIQSMDIWADASACVELDELARANCRNFVREVEIGKFPRELVYNVPEYRELV